MCINATESWFGVDRSGTFFISICPSTKDILLCFSFSIVNDLLACWSRKLENYGWLLNCLSCCKLLIVSKNETNLTSDVVFKLQCGFCNESYYRECVRHLTVKMSEHIGVSNLPKSKWIFCYFVICNCVSTTVHDNGTAQYTFFLIMRFNITIVTNCDSLIVTLLS